MKKREEEKDEKNKTKRIQIQSNNLFLSFPVETVLFISTLIGKKLAFEKKRIFRQLDVIRIAVVFF